MSKIHDAAIEGNTYSMSKLLDLGVDPNTSQDSITALHISAGRWDRKMVELLINKGAKIDVTDKNGRTPLHFAVEGRGLPWEITQKDTWELEDTLIQDMLYVVETLASRSVNVNIKDNFGDTAFSMARTYDRVEMENHYCPDVYKKRWA